jgi:hypothetical protein
MSTKRGGAKHNAAQPSTKKPKRNVGGLDLLNQNVLQNAIDVKYD